MSPLRILHVTPYFTDAWAYGGIPRVADALARGLARRGHAVTVCTTDARDAASRVPADGATPIDGVAVRVFPNISNRLAYHLQLFLPLALSSFLRRHAGAFDVAQLHACRNAPGAIAAHHLRKAGVPYVIAPNGTAPLIERRRLAKRAFDVAFGRRVLRGAARVIAVSDAEQRQLLALGVPADAIRIVPNPIDLDQFSAPIPRDRFRARLGIGCAPLVLFLGKLTPRKRADDLIRAFAALSRHDARLVVAGNDMGSEGGLRSLAGAVGIADRTIFTGLLAGAERLHALADADVVVYPSQDEIFGLVALEALLAGTPVIVADDSGCGEVVRSAGAGQIFPLGDVSALTEAIGRALDTPGEGRRRAVAAASRIRSLYGVDVVCDRLERVYSELVERPRA